MDDSTFGRILDNSFNEIYTFRLDTLKFVHVNFGARKNLGFDLDELLNLTPLDLKPEYTEETFEELVKPLRSKQESIVYFDTVHLRKDLTTYPVSVRLQLMDKEFPPVFVAVIEDISYRKTLEKEKMVCERELVRSNQELGEFAVIASHDLQEPLRKVITFGDRVQSKIKSGNFEVLEDLDRIQNASIRMSELLDDLLKYSQIDIKENPKEEVYVVDILDAVREDLRISEKFSPCSLTLKNDIRLVCDESQLRQVIRNLVSNALKYHKEDVMPVISVDCKSENNFYEIAIEDNGIGFDEKYKERIFHPFQRLHGRSEYNGTGMGLAISKKIIERHDGTIAVKSVVGKGTTFYIRLPKHPLKS
ncbi:MAG: PAS domain S-box protein [Nitrospina sp.]|jgi:two-component system, LuxR family, sensor kinase FixL|nr:PAS domain S-box protein [Nitrospina sp.]MBT5633088.1 PAS domain S-box protein [Nitrospina sp.]MBT6248406.1 PAS domain S-box protein [Nitrospina sp.]